MIFWDERREYKNGPVLLLWPSPSNFTLVISTSIITIQLWIYLYFSDTARQRSSVHGFLERYGNYFQNSRPESNSKDVFRTRQLSSFKQPPVHDGVWLWRRPIKMITFGGSQTDEVMGSLKSCMYTSCLSNTQCTWNHPSIDVVAIRWPTGETSKEVIALPWNLANRFGGFAFSISAAFMSASHNPPLPSWRDGRYKLGSVRLGSLDRHQGYTLLISMFGTLKHVFVYCWNTYRRSLKIRIIIYAYRSTQNQI